MRECETVCAALRGRAEEGSEGEGEGGGLGLGWPQHQSLKVCCASEGAHSPGGSEATCAPEHGVRAKVRGRG